MPDHRKTASQAFAQSIVSVNHERNTKESFGRMPRESFNHGVYSQRSLRQSIYTGAPEADAFSFHN